MCCQYGIANDKYDDVKLMETNCSSEQRNSRNFLVEVRIEQNLAIDFSTMLSLLKTNVRSCFPFKQFLGIVCE